MKMISIFVTENRTNNLEKSLGRFLQDYDRSTDIVNIYADADRKDIVNSLQAWNKGRRYPLGIMTADALKETMAYLESYGALYVTL